MIPSSDTGDRQAANLPYLRVPFYPISLPLIQALLVTRRPEHVEPMASHRGAFVIDGGMDDSPVRSEKTVRLLGYYTSADAGSVGGELAQRGTVILLHGWEGSSHAILNLVMGTALIEAGYDVVRLNLRDHGPLNRLDPIALNEGMFLGTLVGEVRRAVAQIVEWARIKPVYLVGASLGGNFALRIASRGYPGPLADLKHVIAISPVLDPGRTVDRLDAARPFRNYFRKRWLRSVQRKSEYFPHRYSVDGLARLSRIRPMTEWMVRRYTDYESADAYFDAYAYRENAVKSLARPATVVASVDDPVIAVEDIESLGDSPLLEKRILPWGGHVGLIQWPPLRHGMPALVLDILSAAS